MENATSIGNKAAADVGALLRARNPLIWIVTKEEARVKRQLLSGFQTAQYEPRFWNCADGITDYSGAGKEGGQTMTDPADALKKIRDSRTRQAWVMCDLQPWLRDPTVCRALRSLALSLPNAPRNEARAVIVVTPSSDVPPELQGHVTVIDWPLPDRAEVAELLDAALASLPDDIRASAAPNGTRDAAIDAAIGLNAEEAQSCFAKSLVSTRTIDPAAVAAEKKRIVTKEKILEWFDPLPGGLGAVGGLDLIKQAAVELGATFGPRARAYGLQTPRGLMLVGAPGCGKSLVAKALAAAWNRVLLRMDMGALKSKFVGESEQNLRRALQLAEALGAILWIDEIEKGMAGATQGAADGGVSADALGAVLTWMQEHTSPAVVIATANNVTDIEENAPELFRRFDAGIFYVDLPNAVERADILRVSLAVKGRTVEGYAAVAVAACEGFSGAEIANCVNRAMRRAFSEGERDITAADIAAAAAATVPLSRTAPQKIAAVRTWAMGRASPASSPSTNETGDARRLDI